MYAASAPVQAVVNVEQPMRFGDFARSIAWPRTSYRLSKVTFCAATDAAISGATGHQCRATPRARTPSNFGWA